MKKFGRRHMAVVLVCCLMSGLVGCRAAEVTHSIISKNDAEVQQENEAGAVADKEVQAEEKEAATITIPEVSVVQKEIPKTESLLMVQDMKAGWNLGNTLDAYVEGRSYSEENELEAETCWGNPATTKEMILMVKEAGFNTVRIPVTWHPHVFFNRDTGELTIHEAWLLRVKEVVDYAYEEGMYVILNIHHDTSKEYYYPDEEHYERSEAYIRGIWTQVADYFKEYDSRLIFESMNEPRLVGHKYEWWYNPSDEDCRESAECINKLNQVFVDTVRKSGGNNADRYLMVPGYDASIDGATNDIFRLPEDVAQDRLIVSVHAYTPYNFALQAQSESGATDYFSVKGQAGTPDIDWLMNTIYEKYVSQGIPVVIGEYGARDKDGNLQSRVSYYAYYTAAARANGITCCMWDNNAFAGNGENFGVLSRTAMKWRYRDIIDAVMKYA